MATIRLILYAMLLGAATSHSVRSEKSFYAEGMTGTYVPLITETVAVRSLATCPPRLSMKVYAHHDDLSIPPEGLKDASGMCPEKAQRQPRSVELKETDTTPRSVTRLLSPVPMEHAEKDPKSYTASLPRALLQCPGDDVTPFNSLRITSVADLATPLAKSTLKQIGVDTAFIEHTFDGITIPAETRNPWYLKHGNALHRNVDKMLNILRKGNEMVLSRSENPSTPTCSYFGGASSREQVQKRVPGLITTLRPLWKKMQQSPPIIENKEHFLTDNRCKASLSGHRIGTIKLEHTHPGKLIRGVYGSALSVPVEIGDTKCATLQLHRFSAVEAHLSKSPVGEQSLFLANRLTSFLIDHAAAHDYESPTQNRFAREFPAFERELHTLRAKSTLLVGRLDKSKCRDAGNEEPIDMLIVDKSAVFLYCSSFADANLSLSHPCYQQTIETKYGLHRGGPEQSDAAAGSTIFVVGTSGTRPCVYDSSKETAAHFREAFASAFASPTPEPSPEIVPEDSPEPGLDEPVTVPNKGKACFPGAAMVTLRNGNRVKMEDLQIGDDVEVKPGEFSPVIFFSHATSTTKTLMVVFETSSASTATSRSHLVLVDDGLKPASQLEEGDTVWVAKDGALVPEVISHVRVHTLRGLYNPHTRAGTVLVSFGDLKGQIMASSYTTAVHPAAAHTALMPLRWIHHAFGITSPFISNLLPGTFVEDPVESTPGRELVRVARAELRNYPGFYSGAFLFTFAHGLLLAAFSD